MKNFSFKAALPHIISIATILVVTMLFCLPAIQGLKLEQHDMVAVKGMIKNSTDHQEQFGTLPLWNTHMFSGMPNFQILYTWNSPLINFGNLMALGLPEPANLFFIAAIAFYILGLSFGLNPYIALFSALSYAYSSYNPQIINAGHMTKIAALAYAPGVLAGLKLLFDKKYWIGLVLTTLYLSQHITSNHPQITYYLFIICLLMSIVYAINWVKEKEFSHLLKVVSIGMIASLISIGNAAPILMNSVDYAKYTMRGGKNIEIKNNEIVQTKTSGLDYDYASMWSIKIPEITTLFLPNAYGTGSAATIPEDSKFVKSLEDENIPAENAQQLATQLPAYWGGLESVVGPNYLGILAFLMALLGIIFMKDKNALWIGLSITIGAILAFGKYLPSINEWIFHTLPYYNKFRAPSMSLVMIQLLVPLSAGLFLSKFIQNEFQGNTLIKKIIYSLGAVLVILALVYLFNDYTSPFVDKQLKEFFDKNQSGGRNMSSIILEAMKEQRKSTFGSSIILALIYCAGMFSVLYLYIKKIINAQLLVILLLVVNTIDLFSNGSKYLSKENYVDQEELISKNFTPSEADNIILQDKDPHFRVYNAGADAFSETRTSYFHRSIGGYHAAKLRNYQDIIETKFDGKLSFNVLNILDTRYILVPSNQENGRPQLQKNDQALGAAWLIDSLVVVADPVQELKRIDSINPSTTALISGGKTINSRTYQRDSSSIIKLKNYNNDSVSYSFNSNSKQFAVFSEVYYPAGWNAYVDGKKVDYERVNYFLRGMEIEAGKHEISFVFEPAVYIQSSKIANLSGWAFYIVLLGGISMLFLNRKKSASK
jgi:Bacterial membrane protein YfhO